MALRFHDDIQSAMGLAQKYDCGLLVLVAAVDGADALRGLVDESGVGDTTVMQLVLEGTPQFDQISAFSSGALPRAHFFPPASRQLPQTHLVGEHCTAENIFRAVTVAQEWTMDQCNATLSSALNVAPMLRIPAAAPVTKPAAVAQAPAKTIAPEPAVQKQPVQPKPKPAEPVKPVAKPAPAAAPAPPAPEPAKPASSASPTSPPSNEIKIKYVLPDTTSKTARYEKGQVLQDLFDTVKRDLGHADFTLQLMLPVKRLTEEDLAKTFAELKVSTNSLFRVLVAGGGDTFQPRPTSAGAEPPQQPQGSGQPGLIGRMFGAVWGGGGSGESSGPQPLRPMPGSGSGGARPGSASGGGSSRPASGGIRSMRDIRAREEEEANAQASRKENRYYGGSSTEFQGRPTGDGDEGSGEQK